jgi:hypothetical protein
MAHAVRRVEYVWEDEELQEAREQVKRLIKGACSWCEKGLEQVESDGPFVDYVAFGRLQERYVFCATKCMRQFRRQFPTRIHRNCYEDDCSKCDKCIKRYDTTGFKRTILH